MNEMNEKRRHYFTRIEVAVEGIRAGIRHPVLHELLDIIEEAAFYLSDENTPPESVTEAETQPDQPAAQPAAQPRRKSPTGQRMRRADLIADLQEVITGAGCKTISDAINELLQCDVRPATIAHVLKCSGIEYVALRDGSADDETARKFLSVFKLAQKPEA